jgi:hypothetical protein
MNLDFGPMSGVEFFPGESDLILAGAIEANCSQAHCERGGEQQAGVAHQPFGVVRQSFVSDFLPFLQGFVVGWGILLFATTVFLRSKKC